MSSSTAPSSGVPLRTARLDLEPLRVGHAAEAARAFDDPRLHAFTGGAPASEAELRERYARMVAGRSPDGRQRWLNWLLRVRDTGEPAGTVQATVTGATAELAWVVAVPHQGRGYAREAAAAVRDALRAEGVTGFVAHVHPEHAASAAVARAVGLVPTDVVVDGETEWVSG